MTVDGLIFAVHRASLHDGPGLRTTVFFQGCPLRCLWCHNAESQSCRPVLRYRERDCLHCGACQPACVQGCHRLVDGMHQFARQDCAACGACVQACPGGALALHGQAAEVQHILQHVERDAMAAQATGGGLTLSGGEPLAQPELALALLRGARERGLHTCVETSGQAPWAVVERLAPWVDLWLWDCKAANSALHVQLTGASNQRIWSNVDALLATGAVVELRCPLVPGLNDSNEALAALAQAIVARPALQRVWLMPYHRLGVGKAQECGAQTLDQPSATAADRERWLAQLAAQGVIPSMAE